MNKIFRATVSLFLLAFLICTEAVYGQNIHTVNGTILAEDGSPLSEVSVSIEGVAGMPAVSDQDGNFTLECPEGDLWLLILPIGNYKPKRVYLNGRENIRIQLLPLDMISGDDPVGDLFHTDVRKNIMSAALSPDMDKIIKYPNQSIDQSFQSNIPGLWSTAQNGMSNTGISAYLRGVRSMYTSNQPLYIVDGQPMEDPGLFQSNISGYDYNPVASIDPMDITNISILKDYLGAAIYGMKGSNGVILIETLKPTEVQTTIDFSARTGLSTMPIQIPQLNDVQYRTFANEILMSSPMVEEAYSQDFFQLYSGSNDAENYNYNKNTDWQSKVFRPAVMSDYYLRIRGGDEIAKYGLSVSYMNNQGIIKNTNSERFNVRFVGTFNVTKWLSMYISSNLVNNSSDLKESALSPITSPILTSLFKAPILHPYQYDENGEELTSLANVNSLGISNPLAVINNFEGTQKNYRFANSFRAEAKIWEDKLKWTSLLGITFNSLNESVFMPNKGMELYFDGEVYNASKSMKNYLSTLYSDNFLSYRQEFDNQHLFTAAAGLRIYKNSLEIDWGIGKNAHESDEYKQLQNGVSYLREMGGESAVWNRLGVYANAGYAFRNKYFLNANLSTEYSTRTGQFADNVLSISGLPFGLFYSFAGAWRISSEPFLRDISVIEDLKLRVSYGITGNDDIGNLSSIDYYTIDHYRETTGMVPGVITDQSLKFEVCRQVNTGLDISLFGNRLYLTADLFRTITDDLLVFEPQPTYTGSATVPANNGSISNSGWELGLGVRVFTKDKFTWDVGLNAAMLKNRVLDIKDGAVITPFEGGQFISMVDEPVLSFYGYQYDGVFASSEEASGAGLKNEKGLPFGAGDARFVDVSGPNNKPDSVINEYDRVLLGSPIPDLFGGFTSTLRYGRWSLMADMQLVLGREVFNYLRYQNEKMTDLSNQSTAVLNRWTHEGQITDVPRALYDDPIGNSAFSSRWIEDGSFFRLKHLALTYTIAQEVWVFRNLEVSLSATNLFTISKYLGYDPEFSYSYYTMEMGIDYGMLPQSRRFFLGLKVGL